MCNISIEVNHLFWYDMPIPRVVNHFKEVIRMTDMKRTTISFPDELVERIFDLRKDDRFTRCSYSELVRQLTERGLEIVEKSQSSA